MHTSFAKSDFHVRYQKVSAVLACVRGNTFTIELIKKIVQRITIEIRPVTRLFCEIIFMILEWEWHWHWQSFRKRSR